MFDFKNELALIKSAFERLFMKEGLTIAIFGWLTLIGNLALIKQSLSISIGVIEGTEGIADLVMWYVLLIVLVITTPKLLSMGEKAEEFYIKFYTVIVNSVYSAIFLFTLYTLMMSKGYLLELTDTYYNGGQDFNYINSLLLIQVVLWGFAFYINKLLPYGYLNYASTPMFILLFLAIIISVFFASDISIYNYFKVNTLDGSVRLCTSIATLGLYLSIVKKTVFAEILLSKIK